MPIYRLRYFFDAGSGICLWSANDAAREKYGYAIKASNLPLPENTWRRIVYLASWYDTSIDWEYPPGPSPWDKVEEARFRTEAQQLLGLLRRQLGEGYEIVDESGIDFE
jgi:hypothetical protein